MTFPTLRVLRALFAQGIDYGVNFLVEFEPHSIWYETSITMAAQALRTGIKTQYHTFQHTPNEIRRGLTDLGVDVERAQGRGMFDLMDSYTIQTGLGGSESVSHATSSLKLSDWSIGEVQQLKAGIAEEDKRWLHIDDNTGVLLRFNSETAIIDNYRTRTIPLKAELQIVGFYSILKGIASDAFYRQYESLFDGIIEFKSDEKPDGEVEHFIRVKVMRGRPHDSKWHQLKVGENFEVTLEK